MLNNADVNNYFIKNTIDLNLYDTTDYEFTILKIDN